jgi:hypothetical protein
MVREGRRSRIEDEKQVPPGRRDLPQQSDIAAIRKVA